jgi:hypothetical protein
MTDDPFARAAARVKAAEVDRRDQRRRHAHGIAGSWVNTGFRIHASVFLAVNLLLVVTWFGTGGGYPWFIYPFFGWGIGLVAHFASVERWVRPKR